MARRKPEVTRNDVVLNRNAQIYATIRFSVGCLLIGWCVLQLRIGFVEYTKKGPWESLGLAALGIIASLITPSVLIWKFRLSIRRFTSRTIGRLARLEQQADPGRTSSRMNPDGTDPEAAHP